MAGSHTVNLSDTIAQWVTKSNAQDSDIGIRTNLTTTDQTSLVHAINEALISGGIDSATAISVIKNQFGITGGKFSDTATIDFDSSGPRMSVKDSSIGPTQIIDSCITANLFKNHVSLQILNSSGTVLKTLWSPDSPGG